MLRRALKYWWIRPAGGREMLTLALPLIVSTASWTVMNFVDRMFLVWHSTAEMAATMPAGVLHWTILCLPLGIASYVNTFVAQYYGARRSKRIGAAVWQGIGVGVVATPLFLLTIPLAPWLFQLAGHAPEIAAHEVTYFQIVAVGGGASVLAAAMSSFFSGLGNTRVVMLVDTLSALTNVVLDYAWIFGHWGFPEMGIAGAAWATVVSQWLRPILYGSIMALPRYRRPYHLVAGCRFDPDLARRLLTYGGPNGLQMLVEVSAFTLFVLLVGRLGPDATAATTLAFTVNNLAFVPMVGLGIAISTVVGQQLGRDCPRLAARATWTAFVMVAIYMGTFASLYVLVPDGLLMAHASGASHTDFARARELTVILLRFVAVYSLFDAMYLTFVSALKGAGDTRFVILANLILAPFPIFAGWWGIYHLGMGLFWCWSVLTIWACMLDSLFFARFLHGRWKTMRVIEPELNELAVPAVAEPLGCPAE
jgi:MATE family multidrug resistance protein